LIRPRLLLFTLVVLPACLGPFGLPSPADAQQPTAPRHIGVLLLTYSPADKEAQAFRQGLRDAGYSEGRDVVIEWRSANGDHDRLPQLAAELVQQKVDIIVTDVTLSARAALRATPTIPIVMAIGADPVGSGLVTNLAHPGANITGLSLMIGELITKRLQLLKEAIPRASRVVVLWNPATPYHTKAVQDIQAAAPAMSIKPKFVAIRGPDDLRSVSSAVRRAHAQAIFLIDAPILYRHRRELFALAAKAQISVVSGNGDLVPEGALMSYGANFSDLFRRSAGYVDKILKGAKPGDLPVEQPTRFDLIINLKTAKALGITIPESILLQANEVIR
jgi:putative tryptophan/tyrosine transport system substrate-binding protein